MSSRQNSDVQMAAVGVYVGCVKFTAVMIEGAFSHHCTDCPFQIPPYLRRKGTSSVTLAKSNTKALLTLRIKAPLRPAGYLLEKNICYRFRVGRDDGDGIFAVWLAPQNIVTTVTYRHAFGCSNVRQTVRPSCVRLLS